MTVAVVVKVFDGIVLAADSATTLPLPGGGAQVYNNADKIFHLHRRLPVAAMTWGTGNIGAASIATLAKDLRRRLMGRDPDYPAWALAKDWTVAGVAERVVEMFGELWDTEWPRSAETPGHLGMLVAGYSAGEKQAEAWQLSIGGGQEPTSHRVIAIPDYGWLAFAQPQAMERLFNGVDEGFRQQLLQVVPSPLHQQVRELIEAQRIQPVVPAMPFVDAIHLARFMAETTASFSHVLLGPDTVGGMVEVAGINRHEGFRWISRKHYFSPDLNPWGHDDGAR